LKEKLYIFLTGTAFIQLRNVYEINGKWENHIRYAMLNEMEVHLKGSEILSLSNDNQI